MAELTSPPDLELPLVSVIVCTRNRPASLARAVSSILESDYPNFELLVIDQSDDNAGARALETLSQARLRVFSVRSQRKSVALNLAWQQAGGEYLALTDDDIEMATDCIASIVASFQADPTLGIVFGEVAVAPGASPGGYVPCCYSPKAKTIRHPAEYLTIPVRVAAPWINHGMGANMAIRGAVVRELGGWDVCLGPGTKFGSGDDHDFAFRTLRAGYGVHFSPQGCVVHYGGRKPDSLPQYHRRIARGFGAACAKFFKCGVVYHGAVRTLRFHFLRCLYRLVRRQRVSNSASFVAGWISGFCGGLRHPVNARKYLYNSPNCL